MKLPKGFLLSGINCGIKRKKPDLGLIYANDFFKTAGFFTANVNPSYSVSLCKKNINNPIKAILVNSGNANCFFSKSGLADTKKITSALAKKLGVNQANILIASTGIIGKKLPKNKIIKSLPLLIEKLDKKTKSFSQSILTTDTCIKNSWAQSNAGSTKVTISGFAKGAGMIYPNMATMLGFILTDVVLPAGVFRKIAQEAVDRSFNSISVDGCMSTNDTVMVISSKKVPLKGKFALNEFSKKIKNVCLDLAKMIVKDGEGASKFVQIQIKGAKTQIEAKKAGICLANSNLFKCALFGANSNNGRIISALGQVGIRAKEDIAIKSTSLKKKNIEISIDLKRGKADWIVYTCDLTPEYVRLNAEYS